jgi:hypothetical protein
MKKCGIVKTFKGVPSNKGLIYFIVLKNDISIQVEKSKYIKIFTGDIISYYFDRDDNNYKISRVFRKNRVECRKQKYNICGI